MTVKYHKCPQSKNKGHVMYRSSFKEWEVEDYHDEYSVVYGITFCPYCGAHLDWDNPYTETIGDD